MALRFASREDAEQGARDLQKQAPALFAQGFTVVERDWVPAAENPSHAVAAITPFGTMTHG